MLAELFFPSQAPYLIMEVNGFPRTEMLTPNRSIVRLTRCVVMDGAKIEDGAVLTGTVVGKAAKMGKVSLVDCVVQGGMIIEDGTAGKGETYMGFEGGGGLGEADSDASIPDIGTEEDSGSG